MSEPTKGFTWRVGAWIPGFVYVREPGIELRLTTRSVFLRQRMLTSAFTRLLDSSAATELTIPRQDIDVVSRTSWGYLRIRHNGHGVPAHILLGTVTQNSAIYASFRDLGYPVEDAHEVPPARRARLLTLVLGIDAVVVLGAIVFPGAWIFAALPALGLVTFLWALPRLR